MSKAAQKPKQAPDAFTKRERLALRVALENDTASAPLPLVRKLAKLDLVAPTGTRREPQAWPVFYLTPAGKQCALALVPRSARPAES